MKAENGSVLTVAMVGQGAKSSGQFLLSILLVRELGLGPFGALSLVLILAGYGAGLAQALIAQPLLSLVPKLPGAERDGWVRGSCQLGAWLALLGAALAYLFGRGSGALGALGFLSPWSLILSCVLVGGYFLVPVLRAALFATGKRWTMIISDAALPWMGVALVVGASRGAELTVDSALQWLVVAWGASTLVAFSGLRGLAVSGAPGLRAVGARHWQSGRWLGGNQALSWFGTGGFHGATALLLGPAAVGAIRAAMSLVGVLLVACQALELALPTLAARAGDGLRAWTVRWSLGLGAAFAGLGAVLCALAPRLMPMVFIEQPVGPIILAFQVMVWLPALAAVTCVLQVSFRSVEKTRPIFAAYAVSSAAAALVAIPLVQAHGLLGAAAGFTGTQVLFAALLALAFTGSLGQERPGEARLRPATIRATPGPRIPSA